MSQYPPNNGQPPNWQGQPWQGNQSQYPPQQPWGVPPDQPGQWGQPPQYSSPYNQPTQGWQQHPVSLLPLQRGDKPPKKPFTKQNKIIGIGCLGVLLLFLCITCAALNNLNANNGAAASPTTIVAIPSDIPTTADVQAVLPTDTPATVPTDTPTPRPTATPTARPTATPTQPIVQQATPTQAPHCVAVNNNPWCYNFTPGNLIYSPNSAFCSYFACVSTFWTDTNGYVAECANGKYTHSATVSGACSRDGGVSQILYSH
jgi:hypothetical protein